MKRLFLMPWPLLVACASAPSPAERKARLVEQFQKTIDEARTEGQLPAIGVLAKRRQELVYFETQGRRSLQHEAVVTKQDQWHLGSDTKAMTAFVVALAVQDGKFSYETPVREIFGNKIRVHRLNRHLRVGDLLIHVSNLPEVSELKGGRLWTGLLTSTKPVRRQRFEIAKAALSAAPRSDSANPSRPSRAFAYANVNYIVIGAILERVYGLDWEEQMRGRVFDPLAMASCGFGVTGAPDEKEPSQPWPHMQSSSDLQGLPPSERADNPAALGPAGTVHCALEDWSKFVEELVAAWNGKGRLLQNEAAIRHYFSPTEAGPYTFGGWVRKDDALGAPTFRHVGSNHLNFAVASFAPTNEEILLLTTNTGHSSAEAAMTKLGERLSDLLHPSDRVGLEP